MEGKGRADVSQGQTGGLSLRRGGGGGAGGGWWVAGLCAGEASRGVSFLEP